MDVLRNQTILDQMQTYDIPINIKVSADTEEQAEAVVTNLMKQCMDKPVLLRQVLEWDFLIFTFEDDVDHDQNPESI